MQFIDKTIDSKIVMSTSWSSLDQIVQRKNIWKSIAQRMQSSNDAIDSRAIQYHDTFNVYKYNFIDETTDSNNHAKHHDFMSSTLCCLLSKVYDAWRAESCQNHFQRLLFDLIERWVLWAWNRDRKSRKFSKSDVSNANASISSMKIEYSTSLAFNHLSRATHRFDVESRRIKR